MILAAHRLPHSFWQIIMSLSLASPLLSACAGNASTLESSAPQPVTVEAVATPTEEATTPTAEPVAATTESAGAADDNAASTDTISTESRMVPHDLGVTEVPANPQTGYVTLEYQGHCETFRVRGGCCLYYRADETGEKCTTCVLRPEEERNQCLLDYMARKYTQEIIG